MDFQKSKRLLRTLAVVYWVFALLIWLAAGEQFHRMAVASDTLPTVGETAEITDGMQITQQIQAPAAQLTGIDLSFGTFGRANAGVLQLVLTNQSQQQVAYGTVDIAGAVNWQAVNIPLTQQGSVTAGEKLLLTITPQGCMQGSSVAMCYGNTISAGRFDVAVNITDDELYRINGTAGAGMLCAKLNGIRQLSFYKTYWVIVGAAFLLLAGYCIWGLKQAKKGRNNAVAMVCTLYCRYGFLLRQLVNRDFKIKYKRSVLGMAWSFLNPLLTMGVHYLVFSTLFRSDTPNYPVYLLSGIVFFNFFSEAVSSGMISITGNAALIKKVYMPKYIYPISKLFSSFINFVLALIPLFLVMLITGTPIRPSLFLLTFDLLCLMGFVLGMIFLLSTAMTFFQDTQFLWSVVSMMWLYLTPLFYPESIIPRNFLTLYHMNPMYQYITFARICIIDGVSPEPMAYLWCILSSAAVLIFGVWVFRKHQDELVLQL